MTRALARPLWLAATVLLVGCASSQRATPATQPPVVAATIAAAIAQTTTTATIEPLPSSTTAPPTSTIAPASTLVPVDPSVLIPIAVGNKPFPANADELASEHQGYTGDPNAILQTWLVTPMAVPSGPDVRLLGFERTVGINSTTATFMTGPIDPEATLSAIETSLAPSPTYTITPTTRADGSVTIHGFDAQPTTVQGDPPGWSVEVSAVDQLGVVHIKRIDYAFAKVVPTFSDLPPALQSSVLNQDAIAVNVGGVLSSIGYEYGVSSLADTPSHRTRLEYDIASDFPTATDHLKALLTTGWDTSEQADALYFTSTTTAEVWTLDEVGGGTHLTYDTGS
ncbi:MAG TPA: hypothetical protein VGC84_16040 [Ilumatobacteraceae bacterium]|jgi:hypothetical protein